MEGPTKPTQPEQAVQPANGPAPGPFGRAQPGLGNAETGSVNAGAVPSRTRLGRAAAIARSGLKRYPRELLLSLARNGTVPSAPEGRLEVPPELRRLAAHPLGAVWLGHASVLTHIGSAKALRGEPTSIGGITILTDPVFSDRVGLTVGPLTFGIQRLAPVPYHHTALPPIDVILLTHAHFDHFDRPTLKRLASERTTVITARSTGRLVPRGFGRVIELDWFEEVSIGGVRIAAVRPEHWGARMAYDRHRGFNSYLVQTDALRGVGGGGAKILFGGDTAKTDAFSRLGPIDLAVMGIGSYEPWEHKHANPEQVWEMFRGFGGERLLPMHHSTFRLGEEHRDEPLRRLLAAAGAETHRIVGSGMGEVWLYEMDASLLPPPPQLPHPHRRGAHAAPPLGPRGASPSPA